MSAPRPRGYAWVFAHSRFGGQRTGREQSLALASTGKDGRGGCADLPACGEALAPLRPHRLERPVAGPGGDGYAIWSLTGLAVYDRYHLWAGLDDQFHVMNPLWNGRTERATGRCHCPRYFGQLLGISGTRAGCDEMGASPFAVTAIQSDLAWIRPRLRRRVSVEHLGG